MECYAQQFTTGAFPYPQKPIQFKSLKAAKIAYSEFAMDCDNLGLGTPSPMWIWTGNKDDVDYHGGVWLYPEFAFIVHQIGCRGGIQTTYL